ncbi:MAG: hypothetical protein AAFQ52_14225, partial [Chloroflexota bacterium]
IRHRSLLVFAISFVVLAIPISLWWLITGEFTALYTQDNVCWSHFPLANYGNKALVILLIGWLASLFWVVQLWNRRLRLQVLFVCLTTTIAIIFIESLIAPTVECWSLILW